MTHRSVLIFASALGAIAVAVGAFGAHALKSWAATLADGPQRLAWWDTGTEYLFWHVPLLLAVGVLWDAPPKPARVAVGGVAVGAVLFSGSLFVMTLTGMRWLGAVTPLGGTAFIVAWISFAWAAARR